MTSPLDSNGPSWRGWVLDGLRRGCSLESLQASMMGPHWTADAASAALHQGVLTLDQHSTIFVSVAAFCDEFLPSTLKSAASAALHPERLRFGVVDQHPIDRRAHCQNPPAEVRYVLIDPTQSRGVCWARSLVHSLYTDEDFLLQVDSHTLFDRGWDVALIRAHREACRVMGNARSLLTTYPPGFQIGPTGEATRSFVTDGSFTLVLKPRPDQTLNPLDPRLMFHAIHHRPGSYVPSCHVAGGFIFAPGSFVREVPYDPYLYFHGEEQSLALRAYTRGWTLVNPPSVPLYHLYKRPAVSHSNHHWHPDWESRRDFKWADLNRRSGERLRWMLQPRPGCSFSLGDVRTLEDYADEFGIDFRRQEIRASSQDRAVAHQGIVCPS